MSEGIKFTDAVEWAEYVLKNTDGPNGMMESWRNEAAIGRATWTMLNEIKKAYDKLIAENGDL